jgi:glutathione S-transferase
MKLYTFAASPNSLRVTAVAYQLGIELELVPVELGKGEHLKPSFVRLNPNHKIPTLQDGDFVLWESGAIMHYLAKSRPGSDLIPSDLHERMRMQQWMFWDATALGPACGTLLFENFVKGLFKLGDPDAKEIEKAQAAFHRFAKVLDEHLKDREWILDAGLTLADHYVAAAFAHATPGKFPLQDYLEIQRWTGSLFSTPQWKKAFADMH